MTHAPFEFADVLAGLTPFEAIGAGTRDAAEFLGQLVEFGTIQIGKKADLVLVEANPLAHVRNTTQRAGVMLRGQWFTAQELDRRLAEKASSFQTPSAKQ